MADPWESAPIVEEAPKAKAGGLAKRGAKAPADAPWEAAPTVESSLPNVDPGQPTGLQGVTAPPPRTGAAAIPTAEEMGRPAAPQTNTLPPRRELGIKEKVVGAVEAGIEMLAQLTGAPLGMAAGGLAGVLTGGTTDEIGAAAAKGGQVGAGLVRRGLQTNPITGPAIANMRVAGGGSVTDEISPAGQEVMDTAVEPAMQSLPATLGHIGPIEGMTAGLARPGAAADAAGAARGGLARSVQAITDVVKRLPEEEAAPAGSVGAKATDIATQRRERAANLPVPVPVTKGDVDRTFTQQQFEKETAKNPEIGKPLRERQMDKTDALLKNFDDFVDQTEAGPLDDAAIGKSVTDPIMAKAVKAKQEIKDAYDAAKEAGETSEPVPTDTLVRKLNEVQSSKGNAGVIGAAENELVRLGGAARGADGELIPGELTLDEFNELRKVVGSNGGKDETNAHFAGELKAAIDVSTQDRGGELYQKARKLYADYAAEFKNQGVIRDLIGLKKGSSDRKTAIADVFNRSVLNASAEDLTNVRRTLTTAGDKGVQAWNDLRGKTIDWLKEQATQSAVRDERGNPTVSADKLNAAVKKLDRDGRLEILFGGKGAEQLRDVRDLASDVYTAVPGAVNTSNTASALLTALDTMSTYLLSGGSVPLPAMTLIRKALQNFKERKLKAKVRYALGPDEPVKGSPTKAFTPDKGAPPAPPAPKAPPPPAPPTAQAPLPGIAPAPAPAVSRGTRPATKRERELTSLRDQATDPQIIKDIDREIAAERKRDSDTKRAAEYRKLADATSDTELAGKFRERAEKLAPEPPKQPAAKPEPSGAEVETIPVPEVHEITSDRAVDAVIARAEAEAKWAKAHKLSEAEQRRSKDTWQAMQYDAAAVDRAGKQHENSPRVFDREIQRIIDEGKAREAQVQQGDLSSEGLRRPAEGARGEAAAGGEQPRADGNAAAGAVRQGAEPAGGQAGERVAELFRDSKGIKRADMPVVPKGAQAEFVKELNAAGVKTEQQTVPAASLKATQKDYNLENIDFLRKEVEGGRYDDKNRIIVSRDDRVLDGHHRWVVASERGEPINIMRVDLPVEQLLAKAKDFQQRKGLPSRSATDSVRLPNSGERRAADYLAARGDVPADVHSAILKQYRAADQAHPIYRSALEAVGRQLGDATRQVIVAPIKVPSRATEKILVDYKGDASQIKDLVRGTIVLRDIGAVPDAIKALEAKFGKLEGLRNSLIEGTPAPTVDGYRDIKANVRVNGHASEVQVNVPEMIAAKKEAHPLYEQAEAVRRQADKEGRDPTPQEAAQLRDLEARQSAIYDAAWRSATSLRNAGSSTRVPFRASDSSGNLRGGSASQARTAYSAERVTGTPSTSKNSVPAGNDLGNISAPPRPILDDNPIGRQTIATTERGVEVPVRYRLVDAGQLVTSHDDALGVNPAFPKELQPRDRSRDASEAQIARMAGNIKPELLAESYKASDGAPIIGSDAVVESGNARTIALRRAYAAGDAEHYRQWLKEHAGRFGLSSNDVARYERPVLVREALGDRDRAEFARQANESSVAGMSDAEQAKSDALRLPDLEGLVTGDDGQLAGGSQEFIRQFMRYVASPSEHGQLMTADGKLSQRGANRIRNAIFSKAYQDVDLVAMMTESTDANVRNVLAGMLRAAPAVARLRDLLDAGARAGRDFVPDLVEAVRRFSDAREAGQKVDQALAQGSLIGGEASPQVAAIMHMLEADARAPKRIAENIRGMADEIDQAGDPRQAGMF